MPSVRHAAGVRCRLISETQTAKRAREQQRRADRREASRRKADRHPEDAHADGQQAAAVHDEQLRRLRDKHRADKDRRPLVKGACA